MPAADVHDVGRTDQPFLVFIRDFVMRTIAAQSTIAAVGVWTLTAVGRDTKKSMSLAFEVLPKTVPPVRAVIDHYGDAGGRA